MHQCRIYGLRESQVDIHPGQRYVRVRRDALVHMPFERDLQQESVVRTIETVDVEVQSIAIADRRCWFAMTPEFQAVVDLMLEADRNSFSAELSAADRIARNYRNERDDLRRRVNEFDRQPWFKRVFHVLIGAAVGGWQE